MRWSSEGKSEARLEMRLLEGHEEIWEIEEKLNHDSTADGFNPQPEPVV